MYILAIDQGTTGTTSVLFNKKGQIVDKAYREFPQYYPQPGWVEHDPEEIWQTVLETVEELLTKWPGKILAVGITNQRETTTIWNRKTGIPIYNSIVWQCRRTAGICADLVGYKDIIFEKTGMPFDAYFSATKIKWILENVEYDNGADLCFGTIDSWLLWKLTNGKEHATDMTNASRTLLFNIEQKKWDSDLLSIFNIPEDILPEIKNSKGYFGEIEAIEKLKGVPVLGIAGDQQAALFGQACFKEGQIKNTYGTGSFMVMNTGDRLVKLKEKMVSTIALNEEGRPCYALEGAIFIAGAAIQWLRDELQIIKSAAESEQMALAVSDNAGVYFVPAFVGLAAPHWDMAARGAILGLTRGSNKNHIVRAALEAIAYQSYDVFQVMEKDGGFDIKQMMVDGGAVANDFLMQFQADIMQKPIIRPKVIESTAFGAAMIAGLEAGLWKDYKELEQLKEQEKTFYPKMDKEKVKKYISEWNKAVEKVRYGNK
jgi:glycerol kinase